MNEISKLYENAGLSKEVIPCPAKYYGYDCTRNNWDDADCSCDIEGYPPLTAEKQIELIKWLSKRRLLNVAFSDDKNTYQLFNNKCAGSFCSDLATSIATLVQCELDFCTEEEKGQIKDILNDK